MEFMIDYDIQGEILLPLKYTGELKDKLKYEDLSKYNYLNFKKVLLQGELLKFYIVLKIDGEKTQAARDILDGIFLKLNLKRLICGKKAKAESKTKNTKKLYQTCSL